MESLHRERVDAIVAIIEEARESLSSQPSVRKAERNLSLEECRRCGYPAGARLIGTRLSDGGIVWTIIRRL